MSPDDVPGYLLDEVRRFIDDNNIRCAEIIYQCDHVVENALDFIERLCELAGYCSTPLEDD